MKFPFRTLNFIPLLGRTVFWLLAICSLNSCAYYFGNSWLKKSVVETVALADVEQAARLEIGETDHFLENPEKHPLIHDWANQEIEGWALSAKVSPPRQILAKLLLGKEIKEVNEFLQTREPWGYGGSTGPFSKNGDYDFTEIGLVQVLCYFEDRPDLLYPETQRHIAENLIVETGSKPRTIMPGTFRLFKDTENHILMKEFSRYLRNQWLFRHVEEKPEWNNGENGLEKWLVDHLLEMYQTGFYEFNANPYLGYTFNALLTAEAFAESNEIRFLCRKILHRQNFRYMLRSLNFRTYPPYRRRMERAGRPGLQSDPHTGMMKTWYHIFKGDPVSADSIPSNTHQAFIALVMPYRPNDSIFERSRRKDFTSTFAIGHGYKASPEIYSRGENWLISAGGVQRRKISQIAARQTLLIVDDGAKSIEECLYLEGKGKMGNWNHTGVATAFAVAKGGLHVPEDWVDDLNSGNWSLYQPVKEDKYFRVLTYEGKGFSLFAVLGESEYFPGSAESKFLELNPSEKELRHRFVWPDGKVYEYDINAPKSKYVIKAIRYKKEGEDFIPNRKHDFWPCKPYPPGATYSGD